MRRKRDDIFSVRAEELEDANEQELAKACDTELLFTRTESDRDSGDEPSLSVCVCDGEPALPVSADEDFKKEKTKEIPRQEQNTDEAEEQKQPPRASRTESPAGRRKRGGGIYVAVIALCLVLAIALSVGEILHPTDVSPEPDSAQTPNDTEKLPPDTQSTEELTASQLYDRYRQASVTVVAVDGDGKKYLSGTAVFGDGYVATVYSGISKAQRVEVIDSDGKTYAATVVGTDATVDLALLKTDAELKDVRATDKTSFEAGKRLYAIGTVGEAQFGGSLFEGVVAYGERVLELSASDGEIRRAVAVQIGGINSSALCGSPVFDEYGRAVAMVWSGTDDASVGLALPLYRVVAVLEFFKDGEQPTAEVLSSIAYSAPTLGIIGENTSVGELCGVLITDFTDGVCDAAVKLRRGDIIVKIDDTVTGDSISIKEAIYTCTPGDTVEVHVLRDGQRLSFFVELE